MARITKVFASGSIGPVVVYNWKDIPVVRSKPAQVKQTPGTIRAASIFGVAKRTSGVLRWSPLMPQGSEAMYPLDLALRQWLHEKPEAAGEIHWLSPLQLVGKWSFPDGFINAIHVDWNTPGVVRFSVPDFVPSNIRSNLRNASSVALHFAVTGCKLDGYDCLPGEQKTIDIKDPAAQIPGFTIELPCESAPHSVYILTAGWSYRLKNKKTPPYPVEPGVQLILRGYYSGKV